MSDNTVTINKTSEILNELTEDERKVALSILSEISKTGKSQTFNDLLKKDYKEIPVDIETFLRDDRYLGKAWKDSKGNFLLYPSWLEVLKKIFPNPFDTDYDTLLESGARGIGKAQPLTSPVFSKCGYIPMGDVKVGTEVYGRDGKLHKVIAVFPQGLKPVYKVKFSDNTETFCSDEHLWKVIKTTSHNHDKEYVLTLNEIIKEGLTTNRDKSGKFGYKFKIPMCEPINFESKKMFISPYVLGCLIGDGGTNYSGCVKFTTIDSEIVYNINNDLKENGYILSPYSQYAAYGIKRINKSNSINEYVEELERLGLKCKAENKFIPCDYLFNDVESRIALLQGLMDTDGYCARSGYCTFSTSSEQLKDDFIFLVESLGGTAPYRIRNKRGYKNKNGEYVRCLPSYEITVNLPAEIKPFRLTRKLERILKTKHKPSRTIHSIEYVDEQECQCILLDSEEHLYLTNDLIVTHNSEVACGTICPYLMYRVMCLRNPLEFYHLKTTEKIAFAFMNIKLDLSEAIATDKFQKTIQKSPWFMSKGTLTQRNNKPYWNPPDPLEIIIGSQSDDVIGRPIFFAFFDEISFLKQKDIEEQKRKALDMIDTAIGGMKTRFIYNGKNPTLLVVASSKRSEQSFMETYIRELKETQGNSTLVVDRPVWEVKPEGTYSKETFFIGLGDKYHENIVIPDKDKDNLQLYKNRGYRIIEAPIDFRPMAIQEIERMLCDYAGISSFSSNKFLSSERVLDVISDSISNPLPDVIECGNGKDDTSEYKDFFDMDKVDKKYLSMPLFIHLDMSVSGDKTGIAGVWIIGKKPTSDGNPGKDLYFQSAFSTSVKAPTGRQVSFQKNRNFIRWLRDSGFNIKKITFDTFQSYDTGQQLQAEGFETEVLSVDRVETPPGEKVGICKPYQYLKNTIYEQRIKLYDTNLLKEELIQLEKDNNNGKIDHPDKMSKDQSDALCGATFTASKFADEFAYDYGESIDVIKEANNYGSTPEQIVVDFENELKQIGQRHLLSDDEIKKGITPKQKEPEVYTYDGIIVW